MLILLIDALVLMGLLKWLCDEEMTLVGGMFFSFLAAVGTVVVAAIGVVLLGLVGLILGLLVAASLVGVAVSYLFGVEIKQACLIGGLFIATHFGSGFLLDLMFSSAT